MGMGLRTVKDLAFVGDTLGPLQEYSKVTKWP